MTHYKQGQRYRVLKELGSGFYGSVKKAQILSSGEKISIKVQYLERLIEYLMHFLECEEDFAKQYLEKQLFLEAELLKQFKRYQGSRRKHEHVHHVFMRYIKGKSIAKVFHRLKVEKQIKCVKQILKQLERLHQAGYLHLDIHAGNIIVGKKTKIIDFGCCAILEDQSAQGCLTGAHIPPEVLAQYDPKKMSYRFDTSADVYALGMTLYALLSRDIFHYDEQEKLKDFVKRYQLYYQRVLEKLEQASDTAFNRVILSMIAADPLVRPSVYELRKIFKGKAYAKHQ